MAEGNERRAPIVRPVKDRRVAIEGAEEQKDRVAAVREAGEAHIGATEDQVTPTTPPTPNDDEPKQG